MQGFGDIRQIGYLCQDIEQSMQLWMEKAEVGPFTWYKDITLPMEYMGELNPVTLQVGIAFRGNMQIELIQQVNDAPSPYLEYFQQERMGLHHLAYITENMDQALEQARAKGYEIIATIDGGTGRYAYFRDAMMPEALFEFLEVPPDLASFWTQSIEEARNWDGKPAVQVFDLSGM